MLTGSIGCFLYSQAAEKRSSRKLSIASVL
jgi:hypothetical protein